MRFRNESQRRAVFANLNRFSHSSGCGCAKCSGFSEKPRTVLMETPIGTMIAKEDFAKAMETGTIQRLPKKKGIVDIIKEEGGTPDKFELSIRPLDDIKGEFMDIEDDKESLKFLKKYAKSKRPDISGWANKQLHNMYMDAKTARDEARMEDPSKGTDPDYFRSEEDMAWQAERDSEFSSKSDADDIVRKLKLLEVNINVSPKVREKVHGKRVKFEKTISKPIFDKDGEIEIDVDIVPESERRAMFKRKRAELGLDDSEIETG
jgi:hypothetical protein